MAKTMRSLFPGFALALGLAAALGASGAAQEREAPGPSGDSVATGRTPGDRAAAVDPETYFIGDTIVVVEDVEGLVWGDWYVSPTVSAAVGRAIEREGKLSGRTWLESSAPVRDLALGTPAGSIQPLTFVDKGVALDFWDPGEVSYEFRFEGPWGQTTSGRASADSTTGRVRIPLPISEPPDRASLEPKRRAGRLDIRYRPTGGGSLPRGNFTVYLYYLNPKLGYRIAGVGF